MVPQRGQALGIGAPPATVPPASAACLAAARPRVWLRAAGAVGAWARRRRNGPGAGSDSAAAKWAKPGRSHCVTAMGGSGPPGSQILGLVEKGVVDDVPDVDKHPSDDSGLEEQDYVAAHIVVLEELADHA